MKERIEGGVCGETKCLWLESGIKSKEKVPQYERMAKVVEIMADQDKRSDITIEDSGESYATIGARPIESLYAIKLLMIEELA